MEGPLDARLLKEQVPEKDGPAAERPARPFVFSARQKQNGEVLSKGTADTLAVKFP